jgi:phage shock protein A
MGMLKRIKQIVSANINHLIEKAEDPERMLKQLIREMDENIINLRMKVAKGIAAEKRLARRTEETKAAVQTWQNNSEAAVAEGDDDLARKAIARRLYQESTLAELQEQHKKALAVSQTMKEHLRLLENKIQERRSSLGFRNRRNRIWPMQLLWTRHRLWTPLRMKWWGWRQRSKPCARF